MQLEDCCEATNEGGEGFTYEVIRFVGTAIDLDSVVRAIREGRSADQIRERYPALSPEQVASAISCCQQEPDKVDDYMKRDEVCPDLRYRGILTNWTYLVEKVRKASEERLKASHSGA